MTLQFPIGRISDRLDRRATLLGVALATAGAAQGINWFAGNPGWQLFAIAALYGGFAFTVYPLSCAQVNDLANPKQLVQVSAGLLVAYGIGAIAGPIVSSQLMGWFGPKGLFLFIACIAGMLAVFAVVRMSVRTRGDAPKAPYMPLGSIGIAGKQLYASTLRNILRRGK